MRQFRRRSWLRPQRFLAPLVASVSMVPRARRRRRAALSLAGAASLLAGTFLALAPAASAANSTFAVTEVGTAAAVASGIAADPVTDTVYAATSAGSDNGIAVIDAATNTLTTQISLADTPTVVAVDPASDTVYAFSDTIPHTSYAIDGTTDAVTPIDMPSGFYPDGAAVNPTTDMVYVTDLAHQSVVVIDGTTDAITATIPLTDPVLDPTAEPEGVAVDTTTNTIYVADDTGDQVEVIDGATNTVASRIPLPAGSEPRGITADPNGGTVYVGDYGTGMISVIDTASDSVSTLASGIGNPYGVALDPGTGTLYVTGLGPTYESLGTTDAIDTTTGAITAQIPRGGTTVAVTPASDGSAYVDGSPAAVGSGSVTVITPSTVNTMSPVYVDDTGFTFTVGQSGQYQLTASAIPAATFSVTGLPAGLTLSPSGLLSGTPAAGSEGTYVAPLTVSNGIPPEYLSSIDVTIEQPPPYAVQASQQSGYCLDNTGGLASDGNPIQIWSCSGNTNQGWEYLPSVNGIAGDYQLENSNGLCLDDPGDSAVNGTKVQLWSCLGDASQQWTAVAADGIFTEYVNANGLCLDNSGNATVDGNRVQVWACNGDAALHWYGPSSQSGIFPPVSEVRASKASGFCLDNTGGLAVDGNPIQIWSCLGNADQGWKYVPSVNGVTGDYQLENSNGLCLDDPGDSIRNGTNVQLWSCLGDASQTWTQATVGDYVEYVNTANGLCLDNTGDALTDGNRVQVWDCNGDPAQQWAGPSADSGTASA